MPELPEVETVRQTLKPLIVGKTIQAIDVFYDKIIQNQTVSEFKKALIHQTIRDIRRIGKYLLFDMDHVTMVSHLRMEGKYYIRHQKSDCTKHEHIVFELNDGSFLSYHDTRKFGTMELVSLKGEDAVNVVHNIGPEGNDPYLDVDTLYHKIHQADRPIKSILLDQHIISGLGNIYVDETLFRSGINPKKRGKELNYYQVVRIAKAAREVLNKAISLGGTTIRTYHSNIGVDGRFQNELNVHTFVGEACNNCHDTIIKTKVGGRGTYYCPTCQADDNLLVIGLTGGIASGKSTVSKLFLKKRIKVIDADKIYKNLLNSNEIMYNEIVRNFGQEVTNGNRIDRMKLGNIIFNDSKKRELLNQITHPFVLKVIQNELNQIRKTRRKMAVLDIPLLFEAKLEYLCNIIVLVFTDQKKQMERLKQRNNLDEQTAKKRIASQMNLEEKRMLADVVIDNSGSIEQTEEQFEEIYHTLKGDKHVI